MELLEAKVEEGGEYTSLSAAEFKQFAKDSIKCFFLDKSFCWGGKIPEHVLFHESNLNLAMNTSIIEAVDRVYSAMDKAKCPDQEEQVLSILNQIAARWIPKMFAAGIMIMYFRLCKGLPVE